MLLDDDNGSTMYQIGLLYVRADRMLRSVVNEQLEAFNLTLTEWLLLGVIEDAGKDGITLSNVADALDVSQPQVTALMNKVVDQKLVRQKVHRKDRRSRSALITTKGRRLLEAVEVAVAGYMRVWFSEVPKEQLAATYEIMKRLARFRLEEPVS